MMKATLAIVALCLVAGGCGSGSNARVAPAELRPVALNEVVPRMRAAYAKIETARFESEQRYPLGGGQFFTTRSDTTFKAPTSFRSVVTGPPGRVELFSDGVTYVEIGTARQSAEWSLSALDSIISARDVVVFFFDWDNLLSDDGKFFEAGWRAHIGTEWNGREWLVIERDHDAGPYRYFVDPDSYVVWRLERPMPDGSEIMDQFLVSLEIGAPVSEGMFQAPSE